MINRTFQSVLFLIAIVFIAGGIISWEQNWKSDDYALMEYGIDSFGEFCSKLAGQISDVVSGERSLNYWVGTLHTKYFGTVLGVKGTHFFLWLIHLANVFLLWQWLRRIDFGLSRSTYATAFWGVSPWLTQPVFWWTSNVASISTFFALLSVIFHLKWIKPSRNKKQKRWHWLLFSLVFFFLSLTIYELWLALPILLIAQYWYLHPHDFWSRWIGRSIPHSALILLWILFSWIGWTYGNVEPRVKSDLSIVQFIKSSAALFLRCGQWITDTPWLTALRDGAGYMMNHWRWLLVPVVIFLGLRSARRKGRMPIDKLRILGLVFCLFLACRLVLILQGGISIHTRHNYGAGMALAIFVASFLIPKGRGGKVTNSFLWTLLLGLAITSLGLGKHFSETSKWENLTLDKVDKSGKKYLVILGKPGNTIGEQYYYEEQDGIWLQWRLRNDYEDCWVLEKDAPTITGDTIKFTARDKKIDLLKSEVEIYSWENDELVPL